MTSRMKAVFPVLVISSQSVLRKMNHSEPRVSQERRDELQCLMLVEGYFEILINTRTAATANPLEMRRHNSRAQPGIGQTAFADLPRRLRSAPVTAPCKKYKAKNTNQMT